jgi:hypothetical protein
MQIVESQVSLAANHYKMQEHSIEENLLVWVGDSPPEEGVVAASAGNSMRDSVTISFEAQNMAREVQEQSIVAEPTEADGSVLIDPKMQTIRRIMELFTGREIKVMNFAPEAGAVDIPESAPVQESEREGWGMEYDYHEEYHEVEQMDFSAIGTVVTADGKEISFSLDLSMSREFYESISIQIRAGDARLVDPLIVNYDGSAADLTDTKFSFDLDNDGQEDDISFVGPGSGFLVFDRNGDGIVNDGSEMFGPQTGHGFSELSRYDADGNGWVDKADPMYEKLRIWARDIEGNDQIFSLAEKNIGALFLGSVSSPFTLGSQVGNINGEIKESSVFIRENGSVGTIQEIDLAV